MTTTSEIKIPHTHKGKFHAHANGDFVHVHRGDFAIMWYKDERKVVTIPRSEIEHDTN